MSMSESAIKAERKRRAITYQGLYLCNLLLLPGFSFIALIWLLLKQHAKNGIAKVHLFRACQLSVAAGIFIVVIPAIVILVSSQLDTSIMVMLVYFVSIHAAFVMIGMFNIARAMAGKLPVF